MTDAQATLVGFVLSASVFVAYAVRLAIAHKKAAAVEDAEDETGSGAEVSLASSTTEVKPRNKTESSIKTS